MFIQFIARKNSNERDLQSIVHFIEAFRLAAPPSFTDDFRLVDGFMTDSFVLEMNPSFAVHLFDGLYNVFSFSYPSVTSDLKIISLNSRRFSFAGIFIILKQKL